MRSFLVQSQVLRSVLKDPEQRNLLLAEQGFKTKNLGRFYSVSDDVDTEISLPKSFKDLADPNVEIDQPDPDTLFEIMGK
jgi:hypothetical protein